MGSGSRIIVAKSLLLRLTGVLPTTVGRRESFFEKLLLAVI